MIQKLRRGIFGGAEYVQIYGLLDKNIEKNINKRLKDTAKKLKEGNKKTYSNITANFSNVLSVDINNEDNKRETINIDLASGKDIPIEDVFVSSAPLNSFIMEGVFESLAWSKLNADYEKFDGMLDLDKVDTSNYEDIALQIVNSFKAKKENISYIISNSGVRIYGLTASNVNFSDFDGGIYINFIDHKEDIAIYKRYLTNKSIYESDNISEKGIVVFTDNLFDNINIFKLAYGKEDNIFIEELLTFYQNEKLNNKKTLETIKKYFTNIANEDKQRIKNQTENTVGAFYQKEIDLSVVTSEQNKFYAASITEYQATCDISYFKDEAFKDYILMKNAPRADAGMNGFVDFSEEETEIKNKSSNLKIFDSKSSCLYFDLDGNFIGKSMEEAIRKITQSQENPVTETNNAEDTKRNENTSNTTDITSTINNTNSTNNDTNNEAGNNVVENTISVEENTSTE